MLATLVLTHGAGASCDSEFMQLLAQQLRQHHVQVQLFNFPYMQTMLQTGTRRPPDRAPKLLAAFAEQIDQQPRTRPIFIAGKSMGGRMATLLAADPQYAYLPIAGVFAYGYPFFTPKNREQARCQHFKDSRCPLYILHGDRDSFGKPEELAKLTLPKIAHLHWIMQGNHDFIPLKSSGLHQGQLIAQLAKMTADCIRLQLSSTN